MDSAKNRILELRNLLEKYERAYRIDNAPLVSDIEYDALMHELVRLEKVFPQYDSPDSISKRVGSDLGDDFEKVKHLSPMLSLDNVFSIQELREFDSRLKKALQIDETQELEYNIEPKIDGAGISLVYKNGVLLRALTRGDGETGEDITENIGIIKGIAQVLNTPTPPALLEIRGEVYMTRAEFERLCAEKEAQNAAKKQKNQSDFFEQAQNTDLPEKPQKRAYANPRNLTAGTMKLLDKTQLEKRELESVFYFIAKAEGFELDFQSSLPNTLKSWGLSPLLWSQKVVGVDAAYSAIMQLDEIRAKFPFDTDGAVIKLNDCSLWQKAGFTAKSPRWATAWKYKSQRAITTLKKITLQVGRTGAITPVAELESVFLSGSTVSRATLHNADELARKDIREGDKVLIEKAGEIIPAVIEVVDKDLRGANSQPFKFPEYCPVCNTKLVRDQGQAVWRCPNFFCPDRIKRALEHFASRDCMDIEGLGGAVVEKLVSANLVKFPSDIYSLKKSDLLGLDNIKEKSAQNLINAIEQSKNRDLPRLLFAIGIFNIGEKTAKDLAAKFGSLDNIKNATKEELLAVDGVGEVLVDSITAFFADPHNLEQVEKLRQAGVNFLNRTKPVLDKFKGSTFVLTGTLQSMQRSKAKALIESLGGKVSASVSAKTSYVVCGENSGSKKTEAEKLGVKILSEAEFLKLADFSGEKENQNNSQQMLFDL